MARTCVSQKLPAEGKIALPWQPSDHLASSFPFSPQLAFLGQMPSFFCYQEVIPFRSKSSLAYLKSFILCSPRGAWQPPLYTRTQSVNYPPWLHLSRTIQFLTATAVTECSGVY